MRGLKARERGERHNRGRIKYSGLFTNAEKRLEIVLDVHCCSGTLENWRGQKLLLCENKKNRTEKLYVDRVFVCKTCTVKDLSQLLKTVEQTGE